MRIKLKFFLGLLFLTLLVTVLHDVNYENNISYFSKINEELNVYYELLRGQLINLFTAIATISTIAITLVIYVFNILDEKATYLSYNKVINYVFPFRMVFITPVFLLPVLYVLASCKFLTTTFLLSTMYIAFVFYTFYFIYNMKNSENIQKNKAIEIKLLKEEYESNSNKSLKMAILNSECEKTKCTYFSDLFNNLYKNFNTEKEKVKFIFHYVKTAHQCSLKEPYIINDSFQMFVNEYGKNNDKLFFIIASFVDVLEADTFLDMLKSVNVSEEIGKTLMKHISVITILRNYLCEKSIYYMAVENNEWDFKINGDELTSEYIELYLSFFIEPFYKISKERKVQALTKTQSFFKKYAGSNLSKAIMGGSDLYVK